MTVDFGGIAVERGYLCSKHMCEGILGPGYWRWLEVYTSSIAYQFISVLAMEICPGKRAITDFRYVL